MSVLTVEYAPIARPLSAIGVARSRRGGGWPCAHHTATRTSAGTAIAPSLNQYCTACTSVTERIPPATTLRVTTTVTRSPPTHVGAPVRLRRASPAPCSWGSR